MSRCHLADTIHTFRAGETYTVGVSGEQYWQDGRIRSGASGYEAYYDVIDSCWVRAALPLLTLLIDEGVDARDNLAKRRRQIIYMISCRQRSLVLRTSFLQYCSDSHITAAALSTSAGGGEGRGGGGCCNIFPGFGRGRFKFVARGVEQGRGRRYLQ